MWQISAQLWLELFKSKTDRGYVLIGDLISVIDRLPVSHDEVKVQRTELVCDVNGISSCVISLVYSLSDFSISNPNILLVQLYSILPLLSVTENSRAALPL
jgi:hypothetical protein